jgi:O-methyltransferase
MQPPAFVSNFFWWVADVARFNRARDELVASLRHQRGVFMSDSLIVWGRNLGFVEDESLISAWKAHATEDHERGILWRTATLAWAARQALKVEGAFVECGCYRGTTARILIDAVGLERPFWLYDLFEAPPRPLPGNGPDLEGFVRDRFAAFPQVSIVAGRVPESLAQGPERIALLHLDLNHCDSEIGALESLLPRMTKGGVIVLDDFGQLPYRDQHLAERAWFAARGHAVLELPTGQGLVII